MITPETSKPTSVLFRHKGQNHTILVRPNTVLVGKWIWEVGKHSGTSDSDTEALRAARQWIINGQ